MTMQQAFDAYEAVRHRLPPVQRGGACKRVANMDDLADRFDVFLLDAFGVLNIGETAIDGVPDRVARLQKAGKRVMVVTNAASYSHAALLAKYHRLGYDFSAQDVVSSRTAILHHLGATPSINWGLMASEALGRADLEALNTTFLTDDLAVYDAAEGFLMMGSTGWNDHRQSLLVRSLQTKRRPVLVGNPDIVAPREHGFSTEPGCFAHQLADAAGVQPEFFGKPFGNIYDLVFDRLGTGVDPDRMVMVGDSLHTDILGGQTAGIRTALIAGYGFFQGHDIDGPIAVSGIEPDFILDRP